MAWLCPTFQRPERLAELAYSWVKNAPGKKLYVRVWKDDPKKEEYLKVEWPEEFELYEGDYQGAGETLRHLWTALPEEPCYGFIGDDCVLRTPGGIDELERTAGDWFIAYPSDTLQRHRLPTHFCVGARLTNVLNWIVPAGIRHGYMDLPLLNIGLNTGMLRYCPHVVFQHKHFLLGEAPIDDVYRLMYQDNGELQETPWVKDDKARLDRYYETQIKDDILKVLRAVIREFEDPDRWDEEDEEAACAEAIHSSS